MALALAAAVSAPSAMAPPARDSTAAPVVAGAASAAVDTTAAPADTSRRVPGTRLRFGWPEHRLTELGFHLDPTGARAGTCTWFGLAAGATVRFTHGALDRAHLEAKDLSARDLDYLQDQLAREGFHRSCSGPQAQTCTWSGRGVRMTATLATTQITADATPLPPATPVAPPAQAAHVLPLGAAPAAVMPPHPPTATGGSAIGDSIVDLPSLARSGAVLHRGTPVYPARARAAGVMGRVTVIVDVDSSGVVRAARVAKGVPMLDPAALAAARDYRFGPAGYSRRVRIPIVFTPY